MNPYMVSCFTKGLVFRDGVDNEVEYFLQKEGVSKNTAQEFCNKTTMSLVDHLLTIQDLDDRKYDYMARSEKGLLSTRIDRLKKEEQEHIEWEKEYISRHQSQNYRRRERKIKNRGQNTMPDAPADIYAPCSPPTWRRRGRTPGAAWRSSARTSRRCATRI
jgi:hypothetical protein